MTHKFSNQLLLLLFASLFFTTLAAFSRKEIGLNSPPPGTPTNLVVAVKKNPYNPDMPQCPYSCSLKASVTAPGGAPKFYDWEVLLSGQVEMSATTTVPKVSWSYIEPSLPGQTYTIRCRARNSSGASDWTAPKAFSTAGCCPQ